MIYNRLFWALVLLVMLALFIRVLTEGTIKYLSYPSNTKLSVEPNSRIRPFDITICNNNKVRETSYWYRVFLSLLYEQYDPVTFWFKHILFIIRHDKRIGQSSRPTIGNILLYKQKLHVTFSNILTSNNYSFYQSVTAAVTVCQPVYLSLCLSLSL